MSYPNLKLSDFCITSSGGTPSRAKSDKYYDGGTVPWVKSGELRESLITTSSERITPLALKESSAKLVPKGAILLAMYGATVGRLGILGIEAATNQAVCSIIPDPKIADTGYLYRVLRSRVPSLVSQASGGAQPNISQGLIRQIQIPLPSLEEQRRIAAILDQAEELRAKRLAAIALLDQLPQAIFLDMFGDPVSNQKDWPVADLASLARQKPNNGIFRKNPDYLLPNEGGTPVVWVEELFRPHPIDTTHSRKVVPTEAEVIKYGLEFGDLLFCRSSLKLDGIAFSNVYLGENKSALFECHLIRISPDLTCVNSLFLNEQLRLPSMRERIKARAKTATMTTIDQAGLGATIVAIPPVNLQNLFAERLLTIQRAKATHLSALAELDALFASIQTSVFSSQIS